VTANPTRQQLTGPILAHAVDPQSNPPAGRDLSGQGNQGNDDNQGNEDDQGCGDGSAGTG